MIVTLVATPDRTLGTKLSSEFSQWSAIKVSVVCLGGEGRRCAIRAANYCDHSRASALQRRARSSIFSLLTG